METDWKKFLVPVAILALVVGFILGLFSLKIITKSSDNIIKVESRVYRWFEETQKQIRPNVIVPAENPANKVMDGIDQESAKRRNLVYYNFYNDSDFPGYNPTKFWSFRINGYMTVRGWYPFEEQTVITFVLEDNNQEDILATADITEYLNPGDIISYFPGYVIIQHIGWDEKIEMGVFQEEEEKERIDSPQNYQWGNI